MKRLVAGKERIAAFAGAVAICIAGGAFWASAVRDGSPYVYHPDEPAIMARALRIVHTGNLNPAWFRYPTLCIYLQAALAAIVHALTRVPVAPGTEILFEGARSPVLPYYVIGRGLTVLFAMGTTLITLLMTRRLAGPLLTLLAGVTFATSPLVFRSAVFTTVDMALAFFVALSLLLCMRAADPQTRNPGWRLFTAIVVAASLAAGAKYNGALVLVVFAGVFAWRRGVRLRSTVELGAYAAIAIVLFLATTPYALLDFEHFWSTDMGLPAELLHYRTGHPGADTGSSTLKGLEVLQYSIGPLLWFAPVAVALLLVGRIDRRRALQACVLVSGVVVIALPVCLAKVFFERNCLPLLPMTIALSCLGARALLDVMNSWSPIRRWSWIGAVAVALLQLQTGYATVESEHASLALEDTRSVAQQWAVKNLPRHARILREGATPQLHLVDDFSVRSVFCIGFLPISEELDAYDYVVTSSAMSRLVPDPGSTLYGRVFSNPIAFEAAPGNGKRGDLIRIYRTTPPDPPDLESRLVFELSAQDGFADVSAVQQVVLQQRPPGEAGPLLVKATGEDPGLLLPEVPRMGSQRYLVRLSLRAPVATSLELFYTTPTLPDFGGGRSIRRHIASGENRIDIRFGPVELAGRLRLDPGERKGWYRIRSVALYTLPDSPAPDAK